MEKIDAKPCQKTDTLTSAPPDIEGKTSQSCDPESIAEGIGSAAPRSKSHKLCTIRAIVYLFTFCLTVFSVVLYFKLFGTRAGVEYLALLISMSLVSLGASVCHKNYKGPRRMLVMSLVWFGYISFMAFAITFEIFIPIRHKDEAMDRFMAERNYKHYQSDDL